MWKRLNKVLAKRIKVCTAVVLVVLAALFATLILRERISSVEDFQTYIDQFGALAPVVLTLFQTFQVVVPVLPGYLGCAAGAVAFGTSVGFWCNYIGISAGSIAAYFLARKFGMDIVLAFFSRQQYEKWSGRIKRSRSYTAFLFAATLLPLFPDDFLCYFSGVMKMEKWKFIAVIVLGKPWCILAYSILFGLLS